MNDSTKLKDSGKDFDAIFKEFYEPENREKRKLERRRQENVLNSEKDNGLF